jgi:hypothetical protein
MTASLPRPVLLALIGTVLFAGLFVFTRSRSSESESTSSPATPPAAEQSKPDTDSAAATGPNANGAAGSVDSKTLGVGLPVAVGRALDRKKVVVLLFWNRKAVDDRSVHASVARLSRHGGKVAVFDDTVKNLSRYTRITATAQVTQTPSLVIVDRRGNAQVQTGYLDFETIDQFVDTARRR